MSYDPMLEGMMTMAIAMSTGSASEGSEDVQNAEQNYARRNCRLPKKMAPSKEAFEAFGFTFEDIGDDVLCKATLPDGWTLESDGEYCTYLVDEKNRKRGIYFYKGAFYDRSGHMNLLKRFRVICDDANPETYEGPYTISAKDVDGTILFTAGKCEELYSGEYYDLINLAEEYLDANYPEWEDPTKYWD